MGTVVETGKLGCQMGAVVETDMVVETDVVGLSNGCGC